MRTFLFEKEKYGFELLMDLHTFEENPNLDFEPAPHTTDFFEILVFEKAHGYIELNGHNICIGAHNLFFTSPFQKKACHIDLNGLKGFHLVFQNDFLADFFNDKLFVYRLQYFYNSKHPQHLALSVEEYELIRFTFSEIIAEIKNFQSDSPHIIRSLLYFSLGKLNRIYSNHFGLSPETQANSLAYRFKEILEQHIRELHTVDEYCNLLQVSRHKLNKIVRAHFGSTSRELIQYRLLQEIKMELRYSDRNISEIADQLHFSEANNLTRFFNRLEGISPRKYRETYQSDRK